MKKTTKIKLKTKPPWKAKRGHPTHISGAGEHSDKRKKRRRTRQADSSVDIKEHHE
jgi:hypothetical protein